MERPNQYQRQEPPSHTSVDAPPTLAPKQYGPGLAQQPASSDDAIFHLSYLLDFLHDDEELRG